MLACLFKCSSRQGANFGPHPSPLGIPRLGRRCANGCSANILLKHAEAAAAAIGRAQRVRFNMWRTEPFSVALSLPSAAPHRSTSPEVAPHLKLPGRHVRPSRPAVASVARASCAPSESVSRRNTSRLGAGNGCHTPPLPCASSLFARSSRLGRYIPSPRADAGKSALRFLFFSFHFVFLFLFFKDVPGLHAGGLPFSGERLRCFIKREK